MQVEAFLPLDDWKAVPKVARAAEATGFDFLPGYDVDCNLNQLPDSCDIGSGASADADSSGLQAVRQSRKLRRRRRSLLHRAGG